VLSSYLLLYNAKSPFTHYRCSLPISSPPSFRHRTLWVELTHPPRARGWRLRWRSPIGRAEEGGRGCPLTPATLLPSLWVNPMRRGRGNAIWQTFQPSRSTYLRSSGRADATWQTVRPPRSPSSGSGTSGSVGANHGVPSGKGGGGGMAPLAVPLTLTVRGSQVSVSLLPHSFRLLWHMFRFVCRCLRMSPSSLRRRIRIILSFGLELSHFCFVASLPLFLSFRLCFVYVSFMFRLCFVCVLFVFRSCELTCFSHIFCTGGGGLGGGQRPPRALFFSF
jgi:hypothetical protein